MVFQNYALYPHMTIFNNMAFGLQLAKKKKEFISETVGRTSKALGLDQMLERKPQALSGGQRQRVALGRAIVRSPKVFLFDEPLSNLDAKMRVSMRSEISRLHAQLGSTMIYVTHDQVEAMTMGDRICVMKDGNIMQVADPLTLYRSPDNLFVAGFIGSPPMNLLKGKVRRKDGGLEFVESAEKGISVPLSGPVQPLAERYIDKDVVFGVRPEHLTQDLREHPTSPLTSTVEIAEPMGAESLVYLKAGAGNFIARIPGETLYHIGQEVTIHINLEKVCLFDVDTENVVK
jgi:multiple sugar transport system ATP-binding protein